MNSLTGKTAMVVGASRVPPRYPGDMMNVLGGERVEGSPKHLLTIGQLAAYAGVTIKAVRHYHQRGLLEEPPRVIAGLGPADRNRQTP